MKIRKSITNVLVLSILVVVYIVFANCFISKMYGEQNYEEEVEAMKLYAHSVAFGITPEFDEEFEILNEAINFTNIENGKLEIRLKSDRDVRLIATYPIKLSGTQIIIDEENVIYSVSNSNYTGWHAITVIFLLILYVKIKSSINSYYEKKNNPRFINLAKSS